jgi:hypothetical protein
VTVTDSACNNTATPLASHINKSDHFCPFQILFFVFLSLPKLPGIPPICYSVKHRALSLKMLLFFITITIYHLSRVESRQSKSPLLMFPATQHFHFPYGMKSDPTIFRFERYVRTKIVLLRPIQKTKSLQVSASTLITLTPDEMSVKAPVHCDDNKETMQCCTVLYCALLSVCCTV